VLYLNQKYVMVRPDESPTQTEGGLTIPASAQKPQCTGTILRAPVDQEEVEGGRIIYKPNTGIAFEMPEEGSVLFIHVDDELLAVDINEEPETEAQEA